MGNLFSTASSSSTTPIPTKKLLSIASSSTTTTLTEKYDVFISFRGEDTRKGITSHLYKALHQKQIRAFIDNHELEKGDKISPALLRAIERSKIAVVIFSKDYASSKWCLRELVEIIRCKKIVMPVFYEVNASDVRKQKGSFKDSFAKHKNESQEEVRNWREALTEASNSSGWDSFVSRSDAELVDEIVEGISKKLLSERILSSSDLEGLVGIRKRIEPVTSLLCLHNKTDVRIIGIWGMGGVGKTTLADAIFKLFSSQFEGSCFIKNVREKLESRDGLDCLEREVISNVLDERNLKLNIPVISPFIKERLSRQQVFIVLDDVDDFKKLTAFARRFNWFGLGSRIIITSRDRQVLRNCGVNDHNIYEVEGFNHEEALTLFCNYAFRQNHPTKDFMVLTERIVDYAKGNPLALEVLGSSLNGMSKQQWESALDHLKGIVNSGIFEVLKMSYDTLSREEKTLFLDIACFFKGCRANNIAKLLDCELHLDFLIAKSLITIKEGIIEMHDLLQEMGREIVYRESESNPGERSRLWEQDDVISVLRNDMGTEKVGGISLDMDIPEDVHLSCQDVYLSCQVFDKMHNLKFLLFKKKYNYNYTCTSIKLHLPDGLNLPNRLRILQWPEYPLRELPPKFDPEKLVKLDLSGSNIEQLWEGTTHAPNLKFLFLNDCRCLTRIPNLSRFLSLEEVHLSRCKSLVDFPSSIQQLNNLRYLCLRMCSNVTKIPLISRSIEELDLGRTAIEEVPSSIQSLTNLTNLCLYGCRRLKNISTNICKLKALRRLNLGGCFELETFPDILEMMGLLKVLLLNETAIKELPPSIKHLYGLQVLDLSYCKNLEMLLSNICNLKSLENLKLSNCSQLNKLPDNLGNLKSLKELRVDGSTLGQLPSSNTSLENLKGLYSSECRGLTILLGLCSLTKLNLNNCNLMEIPEDIDCLSSLEVLEMCGNMFESLPKSIKRLSKLEILFVRDCNMLRSLTELPVDLCVLDASNCKQLCQALPDASELKLCLHHSKRYKEFLFTNCFNLDQKAVNVFVESLKGYEEPPTKFTIVLPGSEIPNCFSYRSSGSSVNIPVLRQASVNRKFTGFAICAVLEFQEQEFQDYSSLSVGISCRFETCDDKIRDLISDHYIEHPLFMNSDHILLGYNPFPEYYWPYQNPEKLNISLEFKVKYFPLKVKCCAETPPSKVKCCAAYPIYAEPIEIIGATIEDIGETSGRKRDRSDDNEDQVEPHPKRICSTQPN